MDAETEGDLKELRVIVERGVELEDGTEPFYLHGLDSNAFLYRGDSLKLRTSVASRLSSSALADGGYSFKAAGLLIDEFLTRAEEEGEDAALAWIKRQLALPLVEWTFVQSAGVQSPVAQLQIGRCSVYLELSTIDAELPSKFGSQLNHLHPPFISTKVLARDPESARIIAKERFAEADSILNLLTGPLPRGDVHYLSMTEEHWSFP